MIFSEFLTDVKGAAAGLSLFVIGLAALVLGATLRAK